MSKYYLLLVTTILVVGLLGCNERESNYSDKPMRKVTRKIKSTDPRISEFQVDGCLYIYAYNGLAHKGNCTNHRESKR